MTESLWKIFPYPTLSGLVHSPGSLLDPHPDCIACTKLDCIAKSKGISSTISICRYGITFARLDDARVVVGVLATDSSDLTKKAKKRLRAERDRHVTSGQLMRAIEITRSIGPGVVSDMKSARKDVLDRLIQDPDMHKSLAEQLRQDFEKNLEQSHDFLQLVHLVRGHAEAILYDKRPELSPEDAADLYVNEGAIYFSTRLMVMKMDSLIFLQEINRATGNEKKLKIHRLIYSYYRIYEWQARQKEIRISIEGDSRASSFYNNQAIGAVVQGILDNLVKYAPAGSDAEIHFKESETEIIVTFSSLGPKIEKNEEHKIFLPGYRAEAAREIELSGQGIGLATAKHISDALDLGLMVSQSPIMDSKYSDRYRTKFQIRLLVTK